MKIEAGFSRYLRTSIVFGFILTLLAGILAAQGDGTKKRRPLPDEFGNTLMNNSSEKNKMAPVVFRHWFHRSRYTCRLCHVDIGFAMQANGTGVREDDNRKGYFCGACHNGKEAFSVQPAKSGLAEDTRNCDRCHSLGKDVALEYDFLRVTAGLPRGRFGNNVDWEAAEVEGKVKLTDVLPGVSVVRKPLQVPKDYSIQTAISGLPKIVFSHSKHSVWNGCELCHPDIFGVKAGATKFTMQDIFSSRYCGLCHGTVAFPAIDCQRCHTEPVNP